jgi:NAD(P)-dependent dehydrogenase (short-subunit alcohol dehydrogenase family)
MTTVLVSGANRGIGLEFVRQYAADGAQVIAGVRDPATAGELRALAESAGGRVAVHALDVGDDASVRAFRAAVGEIPVDILIANAGVYGGARQHTLGDLDFADWLDTVNVNALGAVRLADAFYDALKRGHDKKAVAITSGMGSTAENGGGFFAYRSSKAALNNAWKTLSLAARDDAITCAVFNPGWVKTDMGGPQANLTPERSVAGLRQEIARLTLADTGKFLNWNGGERAW